MNLSCEAHLQDQIYLLKRSAPLHDAIKHLNYTITFTNERTFELNSILLLTETIIQEASTLSPARLAYYFQHTLAEWKAMFHHICHNTLLPPTIINDVDLDVSFEERLIGLKLIKSLLLLWPPSCEWESPNILLPRAFLASSNHDVLQPKSDVESMKVLIVDVMLAWCCASKTVGCYSNTTKKKELKEEVGGRGRGSNKEEKEECVVPANNISSELSLLANTTFHNLSFCCTFCNDQSNIFDPNQIKKQKRNRIQFLNVFKDLEEYGRRNKC